MLFKGLLPGHKPRQLYGGHHRHHMAAEAGEAQGDEPDDDRAGGADQRIHRPGILHEPPGLLGDKLGGLGYLEHIVKAHI